MDRQRIAAWNQFWSSGELSSFGEELLLSASSDLSTFWRTAFAGLTCDDAVLEVGCGNGALARILVERGEDAPLSRYCGVDLAEVNARWLSSCSSSWRKCVELRGGIPAEHLPFPDEQFSLSVSQFALEYTALRQSLGEQFRCLRRRRARIVWLLHSADSAIVAVAEEELRHISVLLRDDGLLAQTQRMIPLVALARTSEGLARLRSDPTANGARASYNRAQEAIRVMAQASSTPELLYLAMQGANEVLTVSTRAGADEALVRLESQREALHLSDVRLRELVGCALDEAGIAELSANVEAAGFSTPRIDSLAHGSRKLGWTLCAHR